jgi:hypothetical protein
VFKLTIEPTEGFDEVNKVFLETGERITVELEHSLISLSKWESKYQKPFLSKEEKTAEEIFGYIHAMIMTPDVDPEVLKRLSQKNIDDIQQYIDTNQTATTFSQVPGRSRGMAETITSELIYYWMTAFNIPWEAQHWHLSRLLTLIQVCNVKNSKPQKVSKAEAARQRAELNAKRRQELGTTG